MLSKSVKTKRRLNRNRLAFSSEVRLCFVDPTVDFWLVSYPANPGVVHGQHYHEEIRGKVPAMKRYSQVVQQRKR